MPSSESCAVPVAFIQNGAVARLRLPQAALNMVEPLSRSVRCTADQGVVAVDPGQGIGHGTTR
jgi:hypothetical protein